MSHSPPWTAEKWHARDSMLKKRSADAKAPILYVNSAGSQNNGKNLVWFDGNSTLIDASGTFRWRGPQNAGGPVLARLRQSAGSGNAAGPSARHRRDSCRDDARHAGLLRAVSTGSSSAFREAIDSAVAAALHVEALGPEKVLAVNMPTQYNSQTTRDLARQCAENLDIDYKVVPIQSLYEADLAALAHAGYPNPSSLVRENIQARIRGKKLADIAACERGVFTNNGNKTVVALNYFTLYGDGGGACGIPGRSLEGPGLRDGALHQQACRPAV